MGSCPLVGLLDQHYGYDGYEKDGCHHTADDSADHGPVGAGVASAVVLLQYQGGGPGGLVPLERRRGFNKASLQGAVRHSDKSVTYLVPFPLDVVTEMFPGRLHAGTGTDLAQLTVITVDNLLLLFLYRPHGLP